MWVMQTLLSVGAVCSVEAIDSPYHQMKAGFREQSPSEVVEAYVSGAVLGGSNPPRIRDREEMLSAFGYVAPADGNSLKIDFKIVHRDTGDETSTDMGVYRISRDGSAIDYGGFTTVSICTDEGEWRFIADFMNPAGRNDWYESVCVETAICDE